MNKLGYFCKELCTRNIYYFWVIAHCKLNKQGVVASIYGGVLSPDRSYLVALIIVLEYSALSINAQHSHSTPMPFLTV